MLGVAKALSHSRKVFLFVVCFLVTLALWRVGIPIPILSIFNGMGALVIVAIAHEDGQALRAGIHPKQRKP